MLGPLRSRRAFALAAVMRFFQNRRGATGVEYALILVSIMLVAAAAYNMLGRKVDCTTNAATAQLGAGGGGTCAGAAGPVAGGAAAGGAGGDLGGSGGTVGAVNGTFNGSPSLPGSGGAGGAAGGAAGGGTSAGAAGAGGAASGVLSEAAFLAKYGASFTKPGEAATAWKVYQVSGAPTNIAVIGRFPDSSVAKDWPGHDARGTTLDPKLWTPAVNDAWVQGGIDRGATFYLATNPGGAAFNNPPGSKFPTTVYKREYDQLIAAGYTQHGYEMWPPGRK